MAPGLALPRSSRILAFDDGLEGVDEILVSVLAIHLSSDQDNGSTPSTCPRPFLVERPTFIPLSAISMRSFVQATSDNSCPPFRISFLHTTFHLTVPSVSGMLLASLEAPD
eukprot:1248916-Amphidinium_carterae.2